MDDAPPSPSHAHVLGGRSSQSVPPAPLRPTIRQTSQRAELRFDTTASNSVLTAFIAVTLREEIPNHPAPRLASLHLSPGSGPLCIEAILVISPLSPQEQQRVIGAHSGGMDTNDFGKEDSSEDFGCKVIEEPPSPTHG